jgi:hypothetical protein
VEHDAGTVVVTGIAYRPVYPVGIPPVDVTTTPDAPVVNVAPPDVGQENSTAPEGVLGVVGVRLVQCPVTRIFGAGAVTAGKLWVNSNSAADTDPMRKTIKSEVGIMNFLACQNFFNLRIHLAYFSDNEADMVFLKD